MADIHDLERQIERDGSKLRDLERELKRKEDEVREKKSALERAESEEARLRTEVGNLTAKIGQDQVKLAAAKREETASRGKS